MAQLVAEWYEYQSYSVRRTVFVEPLQTGGYECELDVVAFDPKSGRIVHIEPSLDAQSRSQRAVRYDRRFACGRKYIKGLFHGLKSHEQIALFVFASTKVHKSIAGGRVTLLPELLQTIFLSLKNNTIAPAAVPEQYPLIRTLQLVSDYRHLVFDARNPNWPGGAVHSTNVVSETKPANSKMAGVERSMEFWWLSSVKDN